MVTIISGIALLLITLAAFSLFSLKMPKGQAAMSGMANAAVATFLVEAIMSYIAGDLFGISFFKDVGSWVPVRYCLCVPELRWEDTEFSRVSLPATWWA